MKSKDKLAASSYLIKKAEITITKGQRLPGRFAYRPFNYLDSIPAGLAVGAATGLGSAALRKLYSALSSEKDEESDSKDSGSVGASALRDALIAGGLVSAAPALFGDNPVGRNLTSMISDLTIQKQNLPQTLKDAERFIYESVPHSMKQKPFKDLTLNF
jgi:hypothetical protein